MDNQHEAMAEYQEMLARKTEAAKNVPDFGAQLKAMIREGAKDLHSTLDQVFFSQPTGLGEPGTPLVPTQAMVTDELGTLEMGKYQQMLDGYSANGPTAQIHDKDRGMER